MLTGLGIVLAMAHAVDVLLILVAGMREVQRSIAVKTD
jgi:hypothetical protein